LLFYGANEVEHLTNKSRPYPAFTKTENVMEEIYDFIVKNENGFFLVREDDDVARAVETLKNAGIGCKIIKLPYQRAIILPRLKGVTIKKDVNI